MWGVLFAGAAVLFFLVVAPIVVFAQHFWLPILVVGAAVVAAKAVRGYRRTRDDTYGLPPTPLTGD